MKEILNRSQEIILSVLSDGKKRTYEELAEDTGLSYDGVRGRISEMVQLGINIQRLKQGINTLVKMEKTKKKRNKHLSSPRRYSDVVSERLRSIEDFNNVGDFLAELRDDLPEALRTPFYKESDIAAVLLLSDLHFGEIIKNEHGKIVFNTKIARKRMNKLFNNVLDILVREGIKTLRILMLGDMVDGDSIYRNHLFRIEKAAIEQVKDVVRSVVENVRLLTDNDIDIRIDAVRGNHGITNYNNLEEDNWDNVAYDMMDLVFADIDTVLFNHFQTDQVKVSVLDREFVLYHGNNLGGQIQTASGLRNFRGMIGRHKLSDNDVVCVGHLHQFGVESDQGKYLIRNGALPSASEYALKLNLFSAPEQTLVIIEEGTSYPIIVPIEVD